MSAIDALIVEVVDIERTLAGRRAVAENARETATKARQRLDAANADVTDHEGRLDATRQALTFIAGRDDVSDETLDQMLDVIRGIR